MSIIIPAHLQKEQLKKINERIPVSKRSRLISQFITEQDYELPKDKEGIEKVLDWDPNKETVIMPMFFSEAAVYKIDSLVEELKKAVTKYSLGNKFGRSTIIRAILDEFKDYYMANPIKVPETQFIGIYMPTGTKDKLDKYIDKMERSNTINSFLIEEYQKPLVDVKTLKSRQELKERLPIYLELDSIEKAETIAESFSGQKVKKTHIIRDAIYQLIDRLEQDNPKQKELEEKLYRTLDEMVKQGDKDTIREILSQYSIKD